MQGAIALVGAGPGAADLLTLRALRLLQEADVVFYDRLVDPAVLELARRDAERVFVGKEVGASSWPQDRINAVIVAAASLGRGLTERGATDRLMLATATCRPDDAEPDWAAMVQPGTTLAIYMGLRKAGSLVAALRGAEVPMTFEAEVVSEASSARETILRCKLGQLPEALAASGIDAASVIFIRWPKGAAAKGGSIPARLRAI